MIKSLLLSKYPELQYAVSTIQDGTQSYLWRDKPIDVVLQNKQKFWAKQGMVLDRTVGMLLQHGTDMAIVGANDAGRGTLPDSDVFKVDALLTQDLDLVLYCLSADCLPIILYDPAKQALAIAHCSWKNTTEQFIGKVIAKMTQEFDTQSADLVVFIAPAISKQSYVFPKAEIVQKDAGWQPYLVEMPGEKIGIDVMGYNIAQLKAAGVPAAQIEDCGIDTYASKDYFSHRRSVVQKEPEGRFATLACLKTR